MGNCITIDTICNKNKTDSMTGRGEFSTYLP